jgi:hypothetical protein
MVAGFVEVADNEDFRGCGGPIRTEYTISQDTLPKRANPLRRVSFTFLNGSGEAS